MGARASHTAVGRTPALSANRGPSTCTLQPNKKFVVVHQLPHGHRLSNTLKRIFWRPISQFILIAVTLTLKIPVNICHLLKKVMCIIVYVVVCLGTGTKKVVLKTHHLGSTVYSSCLAYSKSKTVLDTPTKRSQGTDTSSLIAGRGGRHKNRRQAHSSAHLNSVNSRSNKAANNKLSRNRTFNNDESAEEHADAGDEKDSPHLYETQEEQNSRTSTPELQTRASLNHTARGETVKNNDKNKQRAAKTSNRRQKVSGSSENAFMQNRDGGLNHASRNDSPGGSLEGDSCSMGSEGGCVFDDDDAMSCDRNSESNGDTGNEAHCHSNGGSKFSSRFSNESQFGHEDSINDGMFSFLPSQTMNRNGSSWVVFLSSFLSLKFVLKNCSFWSEKQI